MDIKKTEPFISALTIAGSDPSGGAGIQMDLKTFATTGVWGMAVVTALTAQNPNRVSGVWAMDTPVITEQIQTLLEDIIPGAVKTGMLATAGIIQTVVTTLPAEILLIVDPVMISTSGHRLLDASAINAVKNLLIPRATLVTPNIPEAEVLTGMEIRDEPGMEEAGRRILDLGARAVVVKGGHGSGTESVDLLITHDGVIRLSSIRFPYQVHGSGCCYSAAVTGYLASGCGVEESCRKGKILVSEAIKYAVSSSSGTRMVNPGMNHYK
ncbi:MAG: bifunctional hydroxymethylpyrimidine kinase/phosphomethylpyrimidine kinase [Methanomicrobiales archaeon HGW-Methanomicrobiales-4]|nr:MAG: bifunctional hydroxymethylpyrimidine kinase/phosphomethylpyrimidine kinase [Methanomicrobiales archaeon HGW-Methanomicrobiales-4]